MIDHKKLPELRTFARVEKEIQLRADLSFAPLVVPNGNGLAPCHRWFKYKEAFSSELLTHILARIDADQKLGNPIRMLDPYCGVGTSLLSAQFFRNKIESVGIECNPFSAFVARTKLAWHLMDPSKIRSLASKVVAIPPPVRMALPSLSSITSGRCITRHMARQIMSCRSAIETLPPSIERDALTLGLASIIESVSRVRRDGRALRIVSKRRVVFRDALVERWNAIAKDVEDLQKVHCRPWSAEVRNGDGRYPSTAGIRDSSIDLILTSPPYPNNIDYNEVYKLELWLLGYATSADQFLGMRRSTFRSHPTCSPLEDSENELETRFDDIVRGGLFADLMGLVIRRVARLEKEHHRGRMKVLLGYSHDTWRSLQEHFRALRIGGRAIYVVGNSLHGGAERPYLVPTDLIYARLAQQVGFKVEELIVARGLARRLTGNHFLRDSIIVLRKLQT